MRVINKQLSTNQALNVSSNSQYQPLRSIYMYSMAAIMTGGTPTGSIKLQASNDPETNDTQYNSTNLPPAVGPTNWVDITGSVFAISAAGETMWNVRECGYNYVRVVYTDASGGTSTTTMTIIFNGKGQ